MLIVLIYWLTIDFDGVYDNYAIDFQKDDGFTTDDIHKFASSVEIQPK